MHEKKRQVEVVLMYKDNSNDFGELCGRRGRVGMTESKNTVKYLHHLLKFPCNNIKKNRQYQKYSTAILKFCLVGDKVRYIYV